MPAWAVDHTSTQVRPTAASDKAINLRRMNDSFSSQKRLHIIHAPLVTFRPAPLPLVLSLEEFLLKPIAAIYNLTISIYFTLQA